MAAPSATDYFRESPYEQLSQGDLVLVPSVVLWTPDQSRPAKFEIPAPPDLGGKSTIPLWDTYGGPPMTVAECRWGPAMILSNDCDLDKEFNREVTRLVEAGYDVESAEARASADPALDPLVVVAALHPYDDLSADQHAGVQSGQRIGYLPVPPAPMLDNLPMFIDLSQPCTVERHLIAQRFASLAPLTSGVLRYKLAELYAARDLTPLVGLQNAIGQRITGVTTDPKNAKATCLVLQLEDGTTVHLEVRTPKPSLQERLPAFVRLPFMPGRQDK